MSRRAVLPEDENEASQGQGVFQSTPDCAERMTGSRRRFATLCPALVSTRACLSWVSRFMYLLPLALLLYPHAHKA